MNGPTATAGSAAADREAVLSMADVRTGSFGGTPLAVLGHPIAHSRSPAMHNAALAALAADDPQFASWHYRRIDVPPELLGEALDLLARRGFRGLNLTVPHKVMAVGLVAEIDPAARRAGAVNTLVATVKGWRGFNTDGYGLEAAIGQAFGAGLAGRPVVLLGAGGAARAAAVECLDRGCARLAILNRTPERLEALVNLLRPLAGATPVEGLDLASGSWRSIPAGSLVINATSLGLGPADPAPVPLAALPRPAAVFDMIYQPPQTALLREAEALGLRCANGLGMLVHQGAKSLEIWSGVAARRTAPTMAAALG